MVQGESEASGHPVRVGKTSAAWQPGFPVAGVGGAIQEYINENSSVFARLRNGLPETENKAIAESTDGDYIIAKIIAQIKLLPLVRESVLTSRLFRILALYGGGIRGTFTAAVLAKWDDMLRDGRDV